MRLLLEIGKDAPPEKVEEVIRGKLARKEKIPGLRTPRVPHRGSARDAPAADVARSRAARRRDRSGSRCRSGSKRSSRREKKLNPNVDFYSASTYYALGIPIDLFTPIFAVSRISGWTAHVLEQYANNRLIRPRAEYIGPEYPQRYVPVDAR